MGREELGKVLLLRRGWTLKEAMTSGRPNQSRHDGLEAWLQSGLHGHKGWEKEDQVIALSIIACFSRI